mgnify:CR=1 FL=1
MLRLRSYEKLQNLVGRGLCQKNAKVYKGLKGIEQASSAFVLARAEAAAAAAAAAPAAAAPAAAPAGNTAETPADNAAEAAATTNQADQ